MTFPRCNALSVVVDDMARSMAFYRLAGLDVPEGADTEGHVQVPVHGGFQLMFDTVEVVRSFVPDWKRSEGEPHMDLALECESPAAVDELYRRLVDAGHRGTLEPFDAPWGQRYSSVLDPDGTPVDLYAFSSSSSSG